MRNFLPSLLHHPAAREYAVPASSPVHRRAGEAPQPDKKAEDVFQGEKKKGFEPPFCPDHLFVCDECKGVSEGKDKGCCEGRGRARPDTKEQEGEGEDVGDPVPEEAPGP